MPQPAVKVEITAADRASAVIERLNKRLERMRAPAERLQKSFGRFAQLSGFRAIGGGFRRIEAGAKDAFLAIGQIVPVLGALTGAASIAGMVRLTTAWANFGSRLGFSSQRIGLSSDRLQSLDGAARIAGASAGALQGGLQTLGQGMWDAVGGRAPELVSTFAALHVQFQNADGSAKSVNQVLPQLADRIAGIRNPFAQAAVAQRLFGATAEDLLPFLRLGSAGIARYSAMAQRYGVTNAEGVIAANRLRMAQAELTLSVEGLGNSIAQQLEPVMTPIIRHMSEWIAQNRGWIGTKIHEYVERLATWLKSIDWTAIGKGAENLWGKFQAGIDKIGGLKSAAEIFLGLWTAAKLAPLAAAVAGTGPIGALVLAIGAIALATERTRNAWAEFQKSRDVDPSTPETRARLTALGYKAAGPDPLFHSTGQWRPTWMGSRLNPKGTLSDAIDVEAGVNGYDRNLLRALITTESNGRMVGTAGSSAFGYTMLTDATAKDEGVDSHDPIQNVRGGARHFRRALDAAGGNVLAAVAAYHDGLGSSGLAWWQSHPGDMSHFSDAGRAEVARYQSNLAAEQAGDPTANRNLALSAAPVSVPSGTAQGGSLEAAMDRLRAELHIRVDAAPGLKASVSGTGSGPMRVASVRTERAMNPEMTPHGY